MTVKPRTSYRPISIRVSNMWNAPDVDLGYDRWVTFAKEDMIFMKSEEAKGTMLQRLRAWVETMNKSVYGTYTYLEANIKMDSDDNMIYKLKVNFRPARPTLLTRLGGYPAFKTGLEVFSKKLSNDPRI